MCVFYIYYQPSFLSKELGQLTNQIAAIRKETETYLQLAEERREANVANMHRVAKYCDEL